VQAGDALPMRPDHDHRKLDGAARRENRFLGEVWVNEGVSGLTSAKRSSFMVAGAGFEPATFGL
jgi:hypothetical protein